MNKAFEKNVMQYLTERRMSSLGNVALHFNCTVDQIAPVIFSLEASQRVRYANSKCGSEGCGGNCSACDTEIPEQYLNERTIIISLEKRGNA